MMITKKVTKMTETQGVDDMILVSNIDEAGINSNLHLRYSHDTIYTYTGSILVAVNPYKPLHIYGKNQICQYHGQKLGQLPPHIFSIAEGMYQDLSSSTSNQSCVISGESGAGKTENTKFILEYLCSVTSHTAIWVEQQILEANTILEAFGNAKTVRNDNSSRFGKFIQVCFDGALQIRGCVVQDYLLEQSRITFQSTDERNYHVFYQLVAAANRCPELKSQFFIDSVESYNYLNQSGCFSLDGVDDARLFDSLRLALNVLNIPAEMMDGMFSVLSAILLLGNLKFEEEEDEERCHVVPEDSEIVMTICCLLGLDSNRFMDALLFRQIQVRSMVTCIPFKINESSENRHAMAKALYSRTFAWLVDSMNKSTSPGKSMEKFIGVLDIFGFENFVVNSFEQLCINYTNEKLHKFFNHYVFALEQEIYKEEDIAFEHINFTDNTACLELIEKSPKCVLKFLDEECRFPQGTDTTYITKQHKEFQSHPSYIKGSDRRCWPVQFGICHYAGVVTYSVAGILDKNKDTQQDQLFDLMYSSTSSFVKDLTRFQGEFDLENWCEYDCSPNFLDLLGVRLEGLGGRQTISRTARSKPTVADTFKHQLSGLVDVLALTNPWYVRCLKPNSKKLANDYCEHEVLTQLQYSGMLDIIRIKREGYPVHMPFSQFLNCYGCLLSMRLSDEIDLKDGVQRVLIYLQLPSYDWQIGKTKVFMRTHIYEVLEVQRKIVLSKLAILIQRMWKGYACRRDYQRIRHAVLVLQQYYRVMCERAAYVHKRRAAIIIQAYTRGMFAREVVRTLKLKKRHQEEQELRERQEQLEQERKEKQRLENERQNQEKIKNECIERGKISNGEIDVSSLLQDVQPSVSVKTGTNEMTLDDFEITTADSQAQLTTLTHLLDNLWQEHNVKVSPNCLDLDELFGFLHESESSTAVLTQQYERYEKKQKALDDINAEFTSLQELLDDKGTCLDEGPANMERSNAFATSSDVGEVTGVKRDDGPGTSSEHDSSHLLNSRSLLPSSDDTDLPLPPPPLGDGADIKSGPLNYSIQDDFPLPPPPPLLTSSQLLDSSTEAASSSTNVRNRDSVVLTNVNTLDFVNLSTNRPLPPPVAPKPSVNKLTLDDETILEVLPPVLPPQTSPLEAKLLLGPVPPIPPPLPPLSGVLHSDLGDSVNSEFVYISSVSASTVSNTNLSSPPPPPVPEKFLLLPPPPPLLPDRLSDDCFTGESSRSDNMDTSFLPSPEPPSSYDNLDYNMPIIPPPPLFNGLSSPLESTSSSPLSVPDVGRAVSGTVSLARSDSTATTTDKYSSTSSFDKGSSKLPKQSSIGPVEVIVNTGIDSEFSDNVLSCDLYSGAYSMHRQSSVESTSTGANPLSPKSFRMGSQEQDSFKRRQIEKRIQDLEDKRICLMENDGDEVENPADMLEFAENHFHEHVRDFVGSVMIRSLRKRSNQDVLTKEEMLQYNKGGLIPTSHLRLHDIENIHLACTIFKELTRYIKEDLKAELAISTIQFIVRCGIERVELRDEIFIQLVRQSSQNPDPSALKRTWLVFCHCTAIFSPSKAFKKYLVTYIKKNLSDKDVSIYSQVCLKQLKRPKFMSRKMPPSAMEISCLESCTHLICRVYFMDGKTKAISVMPCDTSSDVLERLALKIGLRSVEGWALYEVTTEYEKFIRGYEYLTDILAQWELHKRNFSTLNKYESVSKRRLNSTSVGEEEAKFIFRKRVYRDMDDVPNDPVEYSLLFAEAVQKVVKYDEFSVSREVALQLAGLQTQVLHGDYEPGKESRYKDVEQYLSRRILSHSADWPKELELAHKQFGSGKADMEAKVWYLTCVKQFPLYGCTFFPITHKGLWSHKGSTLLAISMNGIKFVKARDKSVIHEFDYSEIERFNVDSNENYISFELKNDVNTDCPQRSFIFETNQKEDIGCLVASYSASHTTWLKTDTDTYMKGRVTEEDRLRVYDEIVGCRMMLIGGHILQKPPEEGIGFLKSTFRRLTKTKIEKLRRRYSVDQLDTAFNAEYWSYTKVPTRQALTRFSDPVLEDLAVQMFNSCLGTEAGQEFRNEVNAHNQMELAQALAQKCLDSDAICNEFFLQLIKQTTENPDLNSEINCWYWQVIAVIICTCLPSNPVLLSYVQVHLKKCSSDSITVEGKYARFSQKCLSRSLPRKKRKFPPSLHEIQYIMQKQQIKSKIFFLSGEHRIIEFDSASSAEELIKAIKTKIGMRSDADSFALYENMGTIEKLMPADDRVVDAISKWDRWVKGNNVNKELKLVFKKRLFITPYLNASDRIECELVAHQLVEDVFERRIPVSEQDAIQLCALKLQSEQDSKTGELDFRSVMRILPRDIRPGIKEEQIVDAHRKIENYSTQECILAFIDLLKSWLFFGAAVFEVKQAYTSTLPKTLMLLVNETGVHLMDSKLTRVFGSYRHMDIGCTSPSLQSIMLIIGDIAKGSKYIFNTNQSSEIASLIRDYGSELKKRGIIRESNDGTINGSVASSIHTLHSTQNTANGIS